MRAIVEAIGSPHFGTQYDPCNYHANEEPYPAAYEVVKPYVRYVHLKGGCLYDPELRPRDKQGGTMRGSTDRFIGYTSIPDGVVNADGVLRRLAQDGYTGYVTRAACQRGGGARLLPDRCALRPGAIAGAAAGRSLGRRAAGVVHETAGEASPTGVVC